MGEIKGKHILIFIVGAFFISYHMMDKLEGYSSREECERQCPLDCEFPIGRAFFGYLSTEKCKNGCGTSYCPHQWWIPLHT